VLAQKALGDPWLRGSLPQATPVTSIDRPCRILFLTRRYPPSVGGIQTHCHKLFTYLDGRLAVTLVALRRESILHLLWFLPYAWMRALLALVLRRVDVIYFSDGVVGSAAALLAPLRGRVRFAVTIYGLEMTYGSAWAQRLMRWGAKQCQAIVVISENTREIAVRWGVDRDRTDLAYVGVEPLELPPDRVAAVRELFETQHGLVFGRDPVLLNIGRQVRRKGLAAFLEHGFGLLDGDLRLVIGGGGPELARLVEIVEQRGYGDRVLLLGPVVDDVAAMLRESCDLFLMPNIHLDDDVEGYGISPLESMYMRTPVVAFAVDALVESVREGGYLVPEGDYDAFAARVAEFLALSEKERSALGQAARDYVLATYSWEQTAQQYAAIFAGRDKESHA